MAEFNPTGPQDFTEDSFTILLKDDNWKLILSKEMSNLYDLIWDEASKLLDWIAWKSSEYYRKIELIPEGDKNSEYSFVSSNIKWFILENKKITFKNI